MGKNSAGVEMTHLAPEGNLWDNVAPYIRRTDVFALEPTNSENPHTFHASGYVDTDEETSRRLYGYERLAPVEYEVQMQPRAKVSVKVGTRAVSTDWRTSDEVKAGVRTLCPHEDCFNGKGERWWCANQTTYDKHMSKKHGGA
jgi:hypothetical protein